MQPKLNKAQILQRKVSNVTFMNQLLRMKFCGKEQNCEQIEDETGKSI